MNQPNRKLRQRTLEKTIRYVTGRIEALERASNRCGWYRVSIFLGGIVLAFTFYWISELLSWLILGVALVAFNVVAYYHRKIERSLKKHHIWLDIKSTQLARMTLDWENIPDSSLKSIYDDHPFEIDLDITGRHSLHQLIDITVSREGSQLLAGWLLTEKPEISEIERRQLIIKELSRLPGFRDKLLLKFRWISDAQLEGKKFLERLNESIPFPGVKWVLFTTAALALINIILLGLNMAGYIPAWWILSFSVYVITFFMNSHLVKRSFDDATFLDGE